MRNLIQLPLKPIDQRALLLRSLLLASTVCISSSAFAQGEPAPTLPGVGASPSINAPNASSTPGTPPVVASPSTFSQPNDGSRAIPGKVAQPEAAPTEAVLPSSGKAPIGVPFPNAIKGAQSQGKMQLPLSTQEMSLDPKHVDSSLNKAQQQADSRLNSLRPGSSDLSAPDIGAIKPELEEMARRQREIRMLEVKQKEAELAIKYWATVYDGQREDAAAKAAASAPAAAAAKAAEAAKDSNTPATTPDNMEQPYPKVVSIQGAGHQLRAVILVPYIGEVSARPGTMLPGNRRVTSITPTGVVVSENGNPVTLGFGDSVPLSPNVPGVNTGKGAPVRR